MTLSNGRRRIVDSEKTYNTFNHQARGLGKLAYVVENPYYGGHATGFSTVLKFQNRDEEVGMHRPSPYFSPSLFDENAWKAKAKPEDLPSDPYAFKVEPSVSKDVMKARMKKAKLGESMMNPKTVSKFDLYNRVGYLQRLNGTEGSIVQRFQTHKCLISGLDVYSGELFHSTCSDMIAMKVVEALKEAGKWDDVWVEKALGADLEAEGKAETEVSESESSKKKPSKYNIFTKEMMEEAQRKKETFSQLMKEAIGQWDTNHVASSPQILPVLR